MFEISFECFYKRAVFVKFIDELHSTLKPGLNFESLHWSKTNNKLELTWNHEILK